MPALSLARQQHEPKHIQITEAVWKMTSKMISPPTLFTVSVDGVNILFDLDTGSDVSCIGRHHLAQLQQQHQLPKIILRTVTKPYKAANNTQMIFDGWFQTTL